MPRSLRFSVLSLLLGGALLLPRDVSAQISVEGAWTVSEWTIDGKTAPAQPGMFIFTSTHYSIFYVNQTEPRATPAQTGPGSMTDAEVVTAYNEFTANAGRYVINGNTITTRAFVAKNPTYMAGWPDNAVEMKVERSGDTLTLTMRNGAVAKLVRREGMPSPE